MKKLLFMMLFMIIALPAYAETVRLPNGSYSSDFKLTGIDKTTGSYTFDDIDETKQFFMTKNEDIRPCFAYEDDGIWAGVKGFAMGRGQNIGTIGITVSTPAGNISKDWGTIGILIAEQMKNMSCREYKKMAVIYSSIFYSSGKDKLNGSALNILTKKTDLDIYPLLSFIQSGYLLDGRNKSYDGGSTIHVKVNKAMVDVLSALFRGDDIGFKKALNVVPDDYLDMIKMNKFDVKQWRYEDSKKTKEQLEREKLEALKKKYGKR